MTELNEAEERKNDELKGQVISVIVLTLMLITFWTMIDLVLLTFIITFILHHIVDRLQKQSRMFSKKHGLSAALVTVLVYVTFLTVIVLIAMNLIPKIIFQISELSSHIVGFDLESFLEALDPRLAVLIDNIDIARYVADMGGLISSAAATVGHFSLNLLFAFVLSFFLTVEKDKIKEFGKRLESSKIAFMYKYFIGFGGVFARTFGKVMKVQVMIAGINCLISSICLFFMGFPSIIGLGFMIFCLGLIPVAGVIISLIPLCVVAFTVGGIIKIVEVIVMIILVHAFEAYILNPKLMASKVRLPVCFVFLVLLVAEHYLNVWGLLIGVPVFIFLLVILDVNYEIEKKKARAINETV